MHNPTYASRWNATHLIVCSGALFLLFTLVNWRNDAEPASTVFLSAHIENFDGFTAGTRLVNQVPEVTFPDGTDCTRRRKHGFDNSQCSSCAGKQLRRI